MNADSGQPVAWWWKKSHECLARWNLQDGPPLDQGQISVGEFTAGGWYVDHGGFGCRLFTDKRAAWQAVQRLMELHEGRWVQVPGDSERQSPFHLDGGRVLYSTEGDDLYSHSGRLKEERWGRFLAAIDAGEQLRISREHPVMGGCITLSEYRDPYDQSTRFVVDDGHDEQSHIVDYPYRGKADRVYVKAVWSHASRRFPYVSSDVPEVPTDGAPAPVKRSGGGVVLYDGWAHYDGS